MSSEHLRAAKLILLLMLPLLQALPAQMLEMKKSSEAVSDHQRTSDKADSWDAGRRSPAENNDRSAEPEVQVEATKRLWIEELTAKAESAEESADLIEEIRTKASSDGLRHLKAACQALCPRCVCGVILMPSLSTGQVGKAEPEPKLPIPATESDAKHAAQRHANTPTKPPVKPTNSPTKTELKPATTNRLLGNQNHDSQLLLDEDISSSVYKKEVGDHDPLSASEDAQSHLGID